MIDFILNHINNDINYLYSLILQTVLIIGSFVLFLSFLKNFKVVPVFKYFLAYFWLMVSLFWLSNLIQTMLHLNGFVEAKYISYVSIFFLSIQSIISGTYCLSAIFQFFKFSPIFFFISLIYHTVALFIFFIQKNIFTLNQDSWLSQFTITNQYQNITLYLLAIPFLIFLITLISQNIYYVIVKKYHPFHRLNLHIIFTLLLYLSFFTLYYYDFLDNWGKIISLIVLLLSPLLSYVLLIKNTSYQQDIINPAIETEHVKVPLLLKMLVGEICAIILPLSLANLLIYLFYNVFINRAISIEDILSADIFHHAIIINLMIIVFSVAFHMIMSKKIIYRVQEIIQGTKEVQLENLNYQIPEYGNDELSALSKSFNGMVDTLKNYKQELKNYSTILENEIEKQTLELRKKRHEAEILAEQNMTLYKQLQKQTNTIIDNITDSLIAVDDQNRIMSINKTFSEKFDVKEDYSGKEITELPFVKQYELDKVITMFKEQKLKKYNYRLDLTKPYYGTLQVYMSAIELDKEKTGVLMLMQDTTPPWGTVLNANTYEPLNLAIVRLFDYDNNKLVETAVTDDNGRFGFFVKPGRYYLTTDKENFHFPSKNRSGYHGEIIEVRSKEEGIIKVNILLDPLENVRLGIQTDAPAPTENANTPVMPIPQSEPTPATTPPDEKTTTKKTTPQPNTASLMGNIPEVPMGPNIQQEADNLMDNTNLVGLGQDTQKLSVKAKTPTVTNSDTPTTDTPETVATAINPENMPIPTAPINSTLAANVDIKTPIANTTPPVSSNTPITPQSAPPTTVISDRARAAKEAKKAELGNKNIEETPGAMLEKIEDMIAEEKKIKGADDDSNSTVSNAL